MLKRPTIPTGHVVKGNVVRSDYQYETFNNLDTLKSGGKTKTLVQASNFPSLMLDLDFLPAASEPYQISPNPKDYILVSLPIVTVGVPNRNLQAFTMEEVSYFDPVYGSLVYQTFNRKPCYVNHDNMDPKKARGVIVDSAMEYVPKYDLWKIHIITLWDRTKDEKLVQSILDSERSGYSMGASVLAFVCSICGKVDNMDAHSCTHMKNKGEVFGKDDRLGYQACSGTCFFENSKVDDPADPTAFSSDIYK
jgi:hypothetical protein